MLEQAHAALQASRYPKLLFCRRSRRAGLAGLRRAFVATLHNCRLVQLGAGAHYLQEDHADVIGQALSSWIADIRVAAPRRRLAG